MRFIAFLVIIFDVVITKRKKKRKKLIMQLRESGIRGRNSAKDFNFTARIVRLFHRGNMRVPLSNGARVISPSA